MSQCGLRDDIRFHCARKPRENRVTQTLMAALQWAAARDVSFERLGLRFEPFPRKRGRLRY